MACHLGHWSSRRARGSEGWPPMSDPSLGGALVPLGPQGPCSPGLEGAIPREHPLSPMASLGLGSGAAVRLDDAPCEMLFVSECPERAACRVTRASSLIPAPRQFCTLLPPLHFSEMLFKWQMPLMSPLSQQGTRGAHSQRRWLPWDSEADSLFLGMQMLRAESLR